jgi:hypothetical protein
MEMTPQPCNAAPESHRAGPPTASASWLGFLLSDVVLRACALFTLASVLVPPEGLGTDLCMCKRLTNAPCPGCGVTRGGSNLVRGQFRRAFEYHPFGPPVMLLIAGLGLLALAPGRWRQAVRRKLLPHARALRPVFWVALSGFFLYGGLRWALVLAGVMTFPSRWP